MQLIKGVRKWALHNVRIVYFFQGKPREETQEILPHICGLPNKPIDID